MCLQSCLVPFEFSTINDGRPTIWQNVWLSIFFFVCDFVDCPVSLRSTVWNVFVKIRSQKPKVWSTKTTNIKTLRSIDVRENRTLRKAINTAPKKSRNDGIFQLEQTSWEGGWKTPSTINGAMVSNFCKSRALSPRIPPSSTTDVGVKTFFFFDHPRKRNRDNNVIFLNYKNLSLKPLRAIRCIRIYSGACTYIILISVVQR